MRKRLGLIFILFFVLGIFIFSAFSSSYIPSGLTGNAVDGSDSNLQAWFKFDDDISDGIATDSSGNNDATCSGSLCPTYLASGGRDGSGAYQFNGANYLTASNTQISGFPFTLSAWVNENGSPDVGGAEFFGIGDSSQGDRWNLIKVDPSGYPCFSTRPDTTPKELCGSQTVNGGWHMITAVFASNTEKLLYVDGEYVSTMTDNYIYYASDIIRIGASPDSSPNGRLNGLLDEVVIYDKALTAGEVLELYSGSSEPEEEEAVCGNDLIEGDEVCDGELLNGETCVTQGYGSGTLACGEDCLSFDISGCGELCQESWSCTNWTDCIENSRTRVCTDANECGTNVSRPIESRDCSSTCEENWVCQWSECVGGVQTQTCVDANQCGTEYDLPEEEMRACVAAGICGNDLIEVGEFCDGSDLGGDNCIELGFDSGTLSCKEDCLGFDTTNCVVELGEECVGKCANKEVKQIRAENSFAEGLETTIQSPAEINNEVMWIKKIKMGSLISNISLNLPEEAHSVRIRKFINSQTGKTLTRDDIKKLKTNLEAADVSELEDVEFKAAGDVYLDQEYIAPEDTGFFFSFISSFVDFLNQLGAEELDAYLAGTNLDSVVIKEAFDEIEIEYYTEAPKVIENEISDYSKQVVVYTEGDLHYENIVAYTEVKEESFSEDDFHLYLVENGVQEPVTDFGMLDEDDDGFYDKIEWIVPSLSSKTYLVVQDASSGNETNPNLEYVEMLVVTSDTIPSKKDKSEWTDENFEEERSGSAKQGYILTVKDEGEGWGNKELDPQRFVIVKIPKSEFDDAWLEPEYKSGSGEAGETEILTMRKYRLPLESFLSDEELEYIQNIPYNDESYREPIIKVVENVADKIVSVDWNNRPEDMILHGSSGNFTICSSGCDYTSLNSWEATENADLTGSGPCIATITEGFVETNLVLDGWTTTSSDYVQISTNPDARHSGVWSDSAFRFVPESRGPTILSNVENLRLDGLQFSMYSYNSLRALLINTIQDLRISNCIITGPTTGRDVQGIYLYGSEAGAVARIWNNIIYGFSGTSVSADHPTAGIKVEDADVTAYIYSNTISDIQDENNYGYGLVASEGTVVAKNNLIFNTVGETFYGTFDAESDYNAADDTVSIGTNSRTEQTFDMVDSVNGDFHLTSSDIGALDYGTDLSSDSYLSFSDDVDGEARVIWDIGADEYDSGIPLECTDDDGDFYNQSSAGCGTADCDDTDDEIYPGATEVCDDSLDNDCDGLTDCDDTDCSADVSCLPVCGDGAIEGDEVCDGELLNDETCVTQGFDGGDLACASDCLSFDTSGCGDVESCSDCGLFGLGCSLTDCHAIGNCYYDPTWVPFVSDCFDISTACSSVSQCSDYTEDECDYDACSLNCEFDGDDCVESSVSENAVVADHTVVELYDDIPEYWLNEVKKMLVTFPGESHSAAYVDGLNSLEGLYSDFQVTATNAEIPAVSETELRFSKAYYDSNDELVTGRYTGGEEDFFASSEAVTMMENYLRRMRIDEENPVSAFGFGWCWDMTHDTVSGDADSTYNVRWGGELYTDFAKTTVQRPWGLDSEDSVLSMESYIDAVNAYNAYEPSTTTFFTTGPVDDTDENTGELGYQRYLKHEYIRDYVNENGGYLFDYADILTHDAAGEQNLVSWDGHDYPFISDENAGTATGHIGTEGSLKIAKAMWWLLARIAGWDGNALTCTDADSDGWNSTLVCNSNGVADCDDTDDEIYPGATEVCDDSVDNDCDGSTDCDDSYCSGDVACGGSDLSYELGDELIWLAFDDDISDGIATDSSGNGYDATCTNCPTYLATGGRDGGGAYQFDGTNDYLEISNTQITDYPFTLSAWVNQQGVFAIAEFLGIGDSSVSDRWNLIMIDETGYPCINSRPDTTPRSLCGTSLVNDDWHMITAVFTSDTEKLLYVDGEYILDLNSNNDFYASDMIRIGAAPDSSPDGYLNGLLGDVKIYDRALSAVEVTHIYEGISEEQCNHDDVINGEETCDGTALGGETCISQGYGSGTLSCLSDCSGYDTSECVPDYSNAPSEIVTVMTTGANDDSLIGIPRRKLLLYGTDQLWVFHEGTDPDTHYSDNKGNTWSSYQATYTGGVGDHDSFDIDASGNIHVGQRLGEYYRRIDAPATSGDDYTGTYDHVIQMPGTETVDIAVLTDGDEVWTFTRRDNQDNHYYEYSPDNGETWTLSGDIATGLSAPNRIGAYMIDDTPYDLVWENGDPAIYTFYRWTGSGFERDTDMDLYLGSDSASTRAVTVTQTSDGNVHVAYWDEDGEGNPILSHVYKTTSESSWHGPYTVGSCYTDCLPSLTNFGDQALVAYQGLPAGTVVYNVFNSTSQWETETVIDSNPNCRYPSFPKEISTDMTYAPIVWERDGGIYYYAIGLGSEVSEDCTDADSDGYYAEGGACGTADCNDNDDSVYPTASETSCNGIDNDCDLSIDEDYVETLTSCGVGICAGNTGTLQCISGEEIDSCDATSGAIVESCEDDTGYDSLDNNCDGTVDLDCDSYCDQDGDGYAINVLCVALGYPISVDCAGTNSVINPGATEIPCNSVDENCDSSDDNGTDEDEDGYTINGGLCGSIDCDDADDTIYPGATEICDSQDNQCSGDSGYGTTDEGCSCEDLSGDVCSSDEMCPGNEIAGDGSLSNCCDSECATPTPGTCSECGDGLFNACDRAECHAISEGCYYEDGPLFTCTECDSITCENYLNEADCVADRCSIQNCGWSSILESCVDSTNDNDLDGIENSEDNCENSFNVDQEDSDEDGVGDSCDNCKLDSNSLQEDSDEDGVGNVCDKCEDTSSDSSVSIGGCVVPSYSNFSEDLTTNFTNVEDLRTVENFSIGVNGKGAIFFTNRTLNIEGIDLDGTVVIRDKSIKVDSVSVPVLNESTILQFYNVDYVTPVILLDGETCSECEEISYTGGTYVTRVPHFSEYNLTEGYVAPTTTSTGGSTTSSGSSSSSSSSTLDTSQLSGVCFRWTCSGWSVCEDGIKTRTCTENTACNVTMEKPAESQTCECFESWICDEWSDSINECGERLCMDLNSCGTTDDKPKVKRSCVTLFQIFSDNQIIVYSVGGALIIAFVVIHFLRKRR